MHSTVAINTNYGDGISACYTEDIYAIETLASLVVIILKKKLQSVDCYNHPCSDHHRGSFAPRVNLPISVILGEDRPMRWSKLNTGECIWWMKIYIMSIYSTIVYDKYIPDQFIYRNISWFNHLSTYSPPGVNTQWVFTQYLNGLHPPSMACYGVVLLLSLSSISIRHNGNKTLCNGINTNIAQLNQ